MSETDLVKQIQLALAPLGVRLFRNNCGAYKKGKYYIRYGLCVGSSDLIGWYSTEKWNISKQAYNVVAIFTAIEIKTPKGIVTPEQQAFLDIVNMSGGLGFVARSMEEALAHFNT